MDPQIATSRALVREWPSFHGSAVPLPSDPFETGHEFVRALHHRLCQPLTALGCAIELMQMGREQDLRLSEQLQSVLRQSDRLMETMGMFRQLFEAQEADAGVHWVEIRDILREVMDDLQPLAELQQVAFVLDKGGIAGHVNMSQSALRQVLWSVLQNCVEVSRGGKICLAQEDGKLVVTDCCRGTGGQLSNVFDPFSFCENKRESIKVSNLPLAVMQRMMLAAGGGVSVAPTKEGRRFELVFPYATFLAG